MATIEEILQHTPESLSKMTDDQLRELMKDAINLEKSFQTGEVKTEVVSKQLRISKARKSQADKLLEKMQLMNKMLNEIEKK